MLNKIKTIKNIQILHHHQNSSITHGHGEYRYILLIMKFVDIWSRDIDFYFRSLASSAPIWQFTDLVDCGAFLQTVTKTFRHHSPPCADSIFQSWGVINNTGSTGNSGLNGFPYQVLNEFLYQVLNGFLYQVLNGFPYQVLDCFTMILQNLFVLYHDKFLFDWC